MRSWCTVYGLIKHMCLHVELLSEYIMGKLTEMCSMWPLTSFSICCQGNFVHAGNILATQRVMRYHPGAHVSTQSPYEELSTSCLFMCKSMFSHLVITVLQVGKGTNNTLFALEDGYVRFTKEVYIPPPRSLEATQVITKLPKGAVLYKTFINVLPVKQEGKFKLVDMF